MAKIEVLPCLQQAGVALLNQVGQGEAMEEGLPLFRQANDVGQAPLDQALFGRTGLVGGKPSLLCQAQAREEGLLFLSREARQSTEVSKVRGEIFIPLQTDRHGNSPFFTREIDYTVGLSCGILSTEQRPHGFLFDEVGGVLLADGTPGANYKYVMT